MLKRLELVGFKSFDKKTKLDFSAQVSSIVGPNGSGKSNIAEALRWVLGEQSMKSMRSKKGEDLIFNGSKTLPKQNRASVSLVFDNHERRFRVPYEEVTVTREVHRDGTNRYLINGSAVRLKDILELLSVVGIGGTSHHIIGQGDADRLLRAKPEERREIIEEALGLNLFQYKKEESEKHFAKTEENIREVRLLRREIAPQIAYLKSQVEKLEKREKVRDELTVAYVDYFAHERAHIAKMNASIVAAKASLASGGRHEPASARSALSELYREKNDLRFRTEEAMRALGRVEGLLSLFEKEEPARQAHQQHAEQVKDPHCRLCGQKLLDKQTETYASSPTVPTEASLARTALDRDSLLGEKAQHERLMEEIAGKETALLARERELRHAQEVEQEYSRRASRLSESEARANDRERAFKQEIGEAVALVGRPVLAYESRELHPQFDTESEHTHEERRRHMERLKIRLEEMGLPDYSVTKEYEDLVKRDEYLTKEIEDLTKTRESLLALMQELSHEISKQFSEGVEKINSQFDRFFKMLFSGGEAKIELLQGEEGAPDGVDIVVSLPNKKVKSLQLLSGGERSLASIALLFAMSQVNPPPFLVLDETDAALDESNSRRYGDIIQTLSETSQLIIVTHNRETMNRAGILYGVTMGSDGVSRVLSVKLE